MSGDRPLIRTALGLLVSASGNVTVVAECGNQPDALAAALESRPDVIIMDLELDAGSTPAVAPHRFALLMQAAAGRPVLVVTANQDPAALTSALQHGISGVVLKTRPADVLLRAISVVAAGETFLERALAARVFHRAEADEGKLLSREKLTPREAEIVELISLGLTNKKIAERLFISETTVRHHLTSIYDKLAVTNRLELMRYTYDEKIAAGY